ncbi:hypothetical protein GDO86_003762 [Hymenochirus boettgeri]|uniref:Uncharacterized protein n=1 Tax=Hymenochirus boettgeri TaxID=247094 RepID=A0A8T2KAT2_9PIPI|nr:hypothetical protein GDO86_003762 [Hymenochirus boettgeri]
MLAIHLVDVTKIWRSIQPESIVMSCQVLFSYMLMFLQCFQTDITLLSNHHKVIGPGRFRNMVMVYGRINCLMLPIEATIHGSYNRITDWPKNVQLV